MTARPAATVILICPGDDGFRVFLVKRNRAMGFMPNLWVFPGGRVDSSDSGVCGLPSRRVTGVPDDAEEAAFRIAAIRETWEEAGILLGTGVLPDDQREPCARGEVAFVDLLEQYGAQIQLERLHPWARWITPREERRRYDTRFYVAVVSDAVGDHDRTENVASVWGHPREVLDAGFQAFPMAPPTWWAMRELREFSDADQVVAASANRLHRAVCPVAVFGEDAFRILLPGHPGHPDPVDAYLPTEMALGPGGWRATFAKTED